MEDAISIKISGIKELVGKLTKLEKTALIPAMQAGVDISSQFTLNALKQNTPVDTGNLRESEHIETASNGLSAVVGPDDKMAPYAIWVELGHHTRSGSWVPGQLFVEKTRMQIRKPIQDFFNKIISDTIKSL